MEETFLKSAPNPEKHSKRSNSIGLIAAGVTGGVVACLYVASAPFITPALRRYCLPFVPATTQQVENVFKVLGRRSGNLVDLGSGDGRMVVEAARRGFRPSLGVELNPWLVLWSRVAAWRAGLAPHTTFSRRDLWKVDLTKQDNIIIFGVEQMMPALQEKLSKELGAEARVVACRFPLPAWQPVSTQGAGIDTVWLYSAASRLELVAPGAPTPDASAAASGVSGAANTDISRSTNTPDVCHGAASSKHPSVSTKAGATRST